MQSGKEKELPKNINSQGLSVSGWTQGREGQSDSSNSGSNLYPVMMHQNTAAFSSSPVFPGFPSMSGSLSSSQHGSGQPLPGTPGSANPFGSPMMSGIDPAGGCLSSRYQNDKTCKETSGMVHFEKFCMNWTEV